MKTEVPIGQQNKPISLFGIVSRRGFIVIFAVLLVLVLIINNRPPPVPDISLNLLGYTNRNGYLIAEMKITNVGQSSVSYDAWGGIPRGWLQSETATGTTNDNMAPLFRGGLIVLRPGNAVAFSLALPQDSLRWKCGFSFSASSARERLADRMIRAGFFRNSIKPLETISRWFLQCVPGKHQSERQFESKPFDVPAAAEKS
jgi:hypothetical protein